MCFEAAALFLAEEGGAAVAGEALAGEAFAGGLAAEGFGAAEGLGAAGAFDAAGMGTGIDAGVFASDAGLAEAAGGATGAGGAIAGPSPVQLATNTAMAESASAGASSFGPGTAGAFDASGMGTGLDATFASDAGLGTGAGPTFSGSGGGTDMVPGSDYSIYSGDAPTDVANPLADETIKATSGGTTGAGGASSMQKAVDMALKYGPLAMQGMSMAQMKAAAQKYAPKIAAIGGPQRTAGEQMIAQANSGQINQADQYAIDQWAQSAIAQSRAYFAKAGLSDSSMATKAESDIAAKATAMKEQARQKLLETGINTLNVVDKYTVAAVQAEMAGDQAAAKQATDFLASYGSWLRTLPTMTGQPGTGTTAKAPAGTAAVPA